MRLLFLSSVIFSFFILSVTFGLLRFSKVDSKSFANRISGVHTGTNRMPAPVKSVKIPVKAHLIGIS
jgi:hypothetical protein